MIRANPPSAQPLPLAIDDIVALLNGVYQGKQRPHLVSDYARHLRGLDWHVERALPFETFCAFALTPPAD